MNAGAWRERLWEGLEGIDLARVDEAVLRLDRPHAPGWPHAIHTIATLQPACLEPFLIEALSVPDREARLAVIESLGRYGSEACVGPLMQAMRRCFLGGRARSNLWIGIVAATALALLVVTLLIGTGLKMVALLGLAFWLRLGVTRLRDLRLQPSREVGAITAALEAIAVRSPTPAVRDALPDLQAVAADVIQQSPETRRRSREAIERIERLTADVARLPIPQPAVSDHREQLPLPATAREPSVDTAPIPSQAEEVQRAVRG